MMQQMDLSRWFIRQDIIDQLLDQGNDTEKGAAEYADRIIELAHLDQAEHKSLHDPFDRSVALVFELVRSENLDPWSIDLTLFLRLFNKKIKAESKTLDLPSCGKLIRLAWDVLRHQADDLYDRLLRADEEDDLDYMMYGGWEMEYDDAEFAFTTNVISGDANDSLSGLFQERVRRDEGRPVTLGELLGALREACVEADEIRLREENRKRHAEAVKEAINSVGNKMHDENLEGDVRRCWEALRQVLKQENRPLRSPIPITKVQELIKDSMIEEYAVTPEDIDNQAWVTTLVSSLHLTHLGAIEVWQEDAPEGTILIRDKHDSIITFDAVMALCQKESDARSMQMGEESTGKERYHALQEALAARAAAAKAAEEAELLSRQEAALDALEAAHNAAIESGTDESKTEDLNLTIEN